MVKLQLLMACEHVKTVVLISCGRIAQNVSEFYTHRLDEKLTVDSRIIHIKQYGEIHAATDKAIIWLDSLDVEI